MKYCYKYKGELKNINTEIKAYFLGFMYGDGTLAKKENTFRDIRISIDVEDSYILDRMREELIFFCPPKSHDYSKYNSKNKIQKCLRLSSGPVMRDLMAHGLVPRKSCANNKDKLKYPIIPSDLEHHFIRGFFDADGSICVMKKRPNLRYVEIGSVCETFLKELNGRLNDFNFFYKEKDNGKKAKQLMHVLYLMKTSDIIKFKKYLYKNATIFIIRKKALFDSLRVVNKVLERKIECPFCASYHVIFNCIRGPSKRLICKNCRKNFSIRLNNIISPPILV